MDIANLIISVTSQGLSAAQAQLNQLAQQAQGAQTANEKFGQSIAGLNKLALVGMGALAATIGGSIKTAIDFEKAMATVAKTVTFTTDNGLANMKKGIEDLTKVIPLAFEELAEIASVGGSLGVVEGDILSFTETIAKMSVAFDITAGEAADSMAKIAGVYQIPIANIGELGDTINAVSNSMAATADDVINFMRRVGGSSQALKIAADDTAALGGAMAALGMQPEIAGTAFNIMVGELAKVNGEVAKTLDPFAALGLNTKEFAETIRTDGVGAILMVLEAAKELGGLDAYDALNDAFGAQGAKIATMAEGLDTVKFALDQVGVGADGVSKTLGSMQAEFESVSSTTANKMELVKNNMRLVASAVGEAFLPAVNDLLASLVPLIEKINIWATANPELIVQIAKVTAVVLGSIIAIAAISGAIGTAISAFTGLFAIGGVILKVLVALNSPLGAVAFALAALVIVGISVYQNWDKIKASFEANKPVWIAAAAAITAVGIALIVALTPISLFGIAIVAIIALGALLIANWSKVTAGLAAEWDRVGAKATEIWGSITSYIGGQIDAIKGYFSSNFPAMTAIVGGALQAMWAIISAQFNLIKTFITTALSVIKAVIKGDFGAIPAIIGNGLKAAAGIVGNMMTNILNIIKTAGAKLFSIGKDFIQGFINGIKSIGSGAASAASTIVGNAIAAVRKRQDSASPAKVTDKLGKDFGKGYANGIKSRGKAVKSEAQKLAEGAIKATQDGIQSLERELRLFGNASPVAAIDDDIKQGKYSGDTGRLRNLTSELESKKQVAEINREIAGYGKIIYDNSMLNTNELTKISYELDNANGKYFSINEEAKKLLRTNAAMADEQKLLASATQVLLSGTRELALLETDGSAYSQLAYDLYDASNAMFDLSDAVKTQMLVQAGSIEQAKKSKSANDGITTSLNSIHKELSLLGDNSALAELMYDLNETDKYAGAAADKFQELVDAVTKLDNVKKGEALTSVMDELAQESPLAKIEADYQRRLEVINDYESQWTDLLGVHSAERLAIDKSYMDAKRDLMLTQGEALFSGLSGMAKAFAGEQSGIYRAMFAVEKGFAIAQSALAIQQSIAKAMAVGFPANIPLIGAAISQGASIVSNIKSLQPQGFKQGGYTGNMGASQVAGVVHGQEYVFDAQSTKNIGVDNLNAMRRGEKLGGDVQVNIINNSSARVEASQDGKTITISDVQREVRNGFTQLQNPNSHSSKMVKNSVQAPRRR